MPGLTSKEASRIEEGLHLEEALITKFGLFAQQCADPECRRLMQEMQVLHQRHHESLIRQVSSAGVEINQMAGGGQITSVGSRPSAVTNF